jgi:hypothetical protein
MSIRELPITVFKMWLLFEKNLEPKVKLMRISLGYMHYVKESLAENMLSNTSFVRLFPKIHVELSM